MITFRTNQLENREVDLVEIMRDLVLRLTPVAEMKDVTLTLDGESSVKVMADSILIQNAVRNLIDNALKYSPRESELHISVLSHPSPRITVADQGSGFPEDEMSVLTNRFSRGKNSSGTIGSGLGLSIAKDVADAHGGKLTLGNNQCGGACVTLSF